VSGKHYPFAPGVVVRCRLAPRGARRTVLLTGLVLLLALLGAGVQLWQGGLLP